MQKNSSVRLKISPLESDMQSYIKKLSETLRADCFKNQSFCLSLNILPYVLQNSLTEMRSTFISFQNQPLSKAIDKK